MQACVDQRKIPGLSRLFSDCLYDFERVRQFYPAGAPFHLDRLATVVTDVAYPATRRRIMADLLMRQNAGASAASLQLLDRFSQAGSIAIVTGQQAGLFGGPLLALHKAVSSALLAEKLRQRGINAVPIFWIATQDHDLAEVNHAWALDAGGVPTRVDCHVSAAEGTPVGAIALGDAITPSLDQLGKTCGIVPVAVRDTYTPQATLGSAFARLFQYWFREVGLLTFDPLDAGDAASLPAECYREVFERQAAMAGALAQRARELEDAGYGVQVAQGSGAAMLFLHRHGRRMGLRRDGHGWKAGDEALTESEIEGWISAHPDLVSPSALLRPVVQDIYLPTLCQITGPAETAYLAQSAVLYQELRKRQPVVWPRASVTLVDTRARRLLDKYDVKVEEIWRQPAEELLARKTLSAEIETKMSQVRAAVEREFGGLAQGLGSFDPTLVDATRNSAQKISHQLEQLEGRVARSVARRNEELQRHAQHLAGSIYPNGQLQERVLSTAGWMARSTGDLIEQLRSRTSVECPDHQLIEAN